MSANGTNANGNKATPASAPEPERLPAHMACDVAIVGYGPVGMIIGTLLAQR